MEELRLSEAERKYFGDLFRYCDEESNGQIPILKATELFRSSNLSNDVINQIIDLSLAPVNSSGLSHINKKQFFSALKLIAAYQSNIPLKPEILTKSIELPVPKFNWISNSDVIPSTNSTPDHHYVKRGHNNIGSYEPIRFNSSDVDIPSSLSHNNVEVNSTDSEVESETQSQRSDHSRRNKNGSPWSTESESPTPTNSVAEAQPNTVWENSATGRGVWPTNTTEEHTQLLGTEEESSDRHSSDEEAPGCVLMTTLTDQHKQLYAAQFASLHPDARGCVSGHYARPFFEVSQLPVSDLRKIWQLADIDCDGALDLTEFSIAMILISARRNNEPVPDELPAGLIPSYKRKAAGMVVAPQTADLLDLVPPTTAAPPTADLLDLGSGDFPSIPDVPDGAAGGEPSQAADRPPSETRSAREWTKFVDSPTSNVSSPGPKPVNFDFHRVSVERDPKIVHPVALRVTPEGARRKEPPPPPPPRPKAQHARSSSLDLDRFRPAPPPRTSPPRDPPPPPRLSPPAPPAATSSNRRRGAFEPYKKSGGAEVMEVRDDRISGEGAEAVSLAEENAALVRMCRALESELNELRREKSELQAKLDSMTQ